MAMLFPTSPTIGESFINGSKIWIWDGASWSQSGSYANYTHATTHSAGGVDAITVAQSQVTDLDTTLATKLTSSSSQVITFCTSATRPDTPVDGQMIYETDTDRYYGWKTSFWASIGGGATGGGNDDVFYENSQTVTASYTISTNKNAITAGPVTIANGVTLTIPTGSIWVVV